MDEAILGAGGARGGTRTRVVSEVDERSSRASAGGRHRLTPAVVVVLLLAALCPLIPASPAAAEGNTIVELPVEFAPTLLNNAGQIAGSYYDGPGSQGLAIWSDGNLQRFPMSGYPRIVDFDDAGEILVAVDNGLSIVSEAGVRALPRPVVGGEEQYMWTGFGPDDDGRVVGVHGWESTTETNAVAYQGASPASPITELSTVLAVNHSGLMFGQLPGDTTEFGFVDASSTVPATGFVGQYRAPVHLGDGGHLLFRNYSDGVGYNYFLLHNGSSTPINGTAYRVNGNGVVALGLPYVEGGDASSLGALRFEDGSVNTIRDLVGGAPQWPTLNQVTDVNDNCDVLGGGQIRMPNGSAQGRSYFASVDGCEPVDIEGEFFRVDGGSPYVKIDDDADVRLRIENSSSRQLTNVQIASTEVVFDEEDEDAGRAVLTAEGAGPPSTLDATGPGSVGFADFKLQGEKAGTVTLKAEITATKEGEAVSGTIEREFEVRQEDLQVNLTLDPPDYEEAEDGTFEPVQITAAVTFTNNTADDMTNVKLHELEVDRVFTGQGLHVKYVSGTRPDPADPKVLVESLKAGETSKEFTAVFEATDDGTVEFSAFATAAAGNRTVAGIAKQRWKAKAKKFVEITSTVTNPEDNKLLNAGGQIIIDGTVENLTTNFDVTLGPLYPTLVGNTGTMNLAYDGNAPNPNVPVPVAPLELEPGQKRTFQVRITTNYSDPRMYEAAPSGGTRAYATFEPWGEAIERQDPDLEGQDPPEKVDIRTYDEAEPGDGSQPGDEPDAQVKADPTDLFKRISIDDSIEFEADKDPAAVAAGIMLGAVQGLGNAAIAAVYSIPDLIKMPYTILVAAYDYQTKVWESFTEEEKELFLTETSFLIVSVLQRNVEFGLKDGKQLYDDVYKLAGDHLIETQNNWQIGDYTKTTQSYSAFMSETVGSVAGPVILSKMAQSPKAIAALERLQVAINTRMAAAFASAKSLKYVDNVLPVLQAIENGAEPTLTAIAKLWGVTPEEIAEYKRICGIIGCLATIRSRHVSSAEWIKKWGALLKPENLKIKTVNELDVLLGYDLKDLGSVIFRKPELVKNHFPKSVTDDIATAAKAAGEATGRPQGSEAYRDAYNKVLKARRKAIVGPEARNFALSKGFKEGTKEYAEAVKRIEDRTDEWFKYSTEYKQWNERGWIDTSFNYEGNAIPEYKFDADGNIIGKLTGADKGNYQGFRLVEKSPGSEEYVVQMKDAATGKWRRITGDIDPVDFTYTDGSPLSPEDHARLIHLLQNSPLDAKHGYTATFKGFMDPKTGKLVVEPGPELVKKQFKPNEPALQIAPGEAPPRATRIDIENSRWNDPYDYNMRWVNGFVDAGTKRARGTPQSVDADFGLVPNNSPAQIALPVKSKAPEPTVGRFVIKYANEGETAALIMGANGRLQTVLPDGTTQDSPLNEQAFSDGPIETITVAPVSVLEGEDPEPNQSPLRLFGFGGGVVPVEAVSAVSTGAMASRVAADVVRLSAVSLASGSDTIMVSTAPGFAGGDSGFVAGQQIAIGTGSDRMEVREIASVLDGVITLTEALEYDHNVDDVVVMVVSASGVPVDPDKGVDPTPDPDPDPDPGTDPGTDPSSDPGTDGGSGNDGTNGTGGDATPVAVQGSTGSSGDGTSGAGSAGASGSVSSTGGTSGGSPLAYTGSNPLALVLFALFVIALGVLMNRRKWHRLGSAGGGRKV